MSIKYYIVFAIIFIMTMIYIFTMHFYKTIFPPEMHDLLYSMSALLPVSYCVIVLLPVGALILGKNKKMEL